MFIYRGVTHKKIIVSSLLLLRLFHQSLPYLKSNIRELAADNTDKEAFEKVLLLVLEFSASTIKRVLLVILKLQLQARNFKMH